LVYIIFLLCAALAFITYGLNRTLCPSTGTNTPYSMVVNGNRIPVYNSDVRVFGQLYPMDVMKSFFATKGMNLTNDYENTDISGIFDGDTGNYCSSFDTTTSTTLSSCSLVDPYGGGMTAPNNTCLSLAELKNYYKTDMGVIGFDWADLDTSSITGRGLVLLGDSGKATNIFIYIYL
jgi:chitin synthase